MSYETLAAFRQETCDPNGPIRAQHVPGMNGHPSEIRINADDRSLVQAAADRHGITLTGDGRWNATTPGRITLITTRTIPAAAVAASLARALLDWDTALAAGENLFDGLDPLTGMNALADLLTLPAPGYYIRVIADALAAHAYIDLVSTENPRTAFATNPPVTPGAHEMLTTLLTDDVAADLPNQLHHALPKELAVAALHKADLIETCRIESSERVTRTPRRSTARDRANQWATIKKAAPGTPAGDSRWLGA